MAWWKMSVCLLGMCTLGCAGSDGGTSGVADLKRQACEQERKTAFQRCYRRYGDTDGDHVLFEGRLGSECSAIAREAHTACRRRR